MKVSSCWKLLSSSSIRKFWLLGIPCTNRTSLQGRLSTAPAQHLHADIHSPVDLQNDEIHTILPRLPFVFHWQAWSFASRYPGGLDPAEAVPDGYRIPLVSKYPKSVRQHRAKAMRHRHDETSYGLPTDADGSIFPYLVGFTHRPATARI